MNTAFAALLAGAIVLIELLIGGTRLVFSLPSYALHAIVALLTIFRAPARFGFGRVLGGTLRCRK